MSSEYEQRRLENIERNANYLKDIGIHEKKIVKKVVPKRNPVVYDEIPTRKSARCEGMVAVNYREPTLPPAESRSVSKFAKDDPTMKDERIVVKRESLTGRFVVPDNHHEVLNTYSKFIHQETSSESSSKLMANLNIFYEKYLGKRVESFGKAAVMSIANNNVLPKFNKFSGVVEWKNAMFLWVNKGDYGAYDNEFTENGKYMMWYGGSRMTEVTPVILRLEKAGREKYKTENSDTILLFVRLVGENYCCFGRVSIAGCNLLLDPVQIEFELLDHEILQDNKLFQQIINTKNREFVMPN